ncbi:hypothetical protein L3Q82_024539 [Scortum barcoo]|uniref:Uncharacterized protein n=1 Tax=Scortum barcoo TaxID=214431 RepID=A0ACB8WQ26_9TELE|nr:hypothetical protein L3Q82_024539 [Scortum barcoo]
MKTLKIRGITSDMMFISKMITAKGRAVSLNDRLTSLFTRKKLKCQYLALLLIMKTYWDVCTEGGTSAAVGDGKAILRDLQPNNPTYAGVPLPENTPRFPLAQTQDKIILSKQTGHVDSSQELTDTSDCRSVGLSLRGRVRSSNIQTAFRAKPYEPRRFTCLIRMPLGHLSLEVFRVDPEHAGGTTLLIWPGNTSASPRGAGKHCWGEGRLDFLA